MATRVATTNKEASDTAYAWSGILTGDDGNGLPIRGGRYAFVAIGTPGGAAPSLALQYSPDGLTFIPLANPLTAAGMVVYELPSGIVKPVMGGGDGTTNLVVHLKPIPRQVNT